MTHPAAVEPAQDISDAEIDALVVMVYGPLVSLPVRTLLELREFARAILARRSESVRDGALEEAALVCDGVDNYANPMTANDCADAIRALKGQRP